jgi:hypothetical protein
MPQLHQLHQHPPQVVNLEAMEVLVPRIDMFDHSGGAGVPAYAISETINTLGTEYLFVGLGAGVRRNAGPAACPTCQIADVRIRPTWAMRASSVL